MLLRVIDIETTGLALPAEVIEIGRVDVRLDNSVASIERPKALAQRKDCALRCGMEQRRARLSPTTATLSVHLYQKRSPGICPGYALTRWLYEFGQMLRDTQIRF